MVCLKEMRDGGAADKLPIRGGIAFASPQIGQWWWCRLQPNVALIATNLETMPGPLHGLDLSSPCCN